MLKRSQAFERGRSDALKDKAPIFRQVSNRIVPEIDDEMGEEWDETMRSDYLEGYNSAPLYW